MNKTKNAPIIITILIIVAAVTIYWIAKPKGEVPNTVTSNEAYVLDQKNCTYAIEGKDIDLKDGHSELDMAPESASRLITNYFGNNISGDFNNDGAEDVAFLLTQDSGGSGTFFYIAAALGGDKCTGTNAVLLGDRIAPQNIDFIDGEIIANYAQRDQDEPMTNSPSIGVSRYFKIAGNRLEEISK